MNDIRRAAGVSTGAI
ncbi:MAG: hypothetical protein QNL62_09980 [Gammaproteobacteria bacterium]|nr:hypothetical protein [Gammaproteobacteria bacterium]